MGKIPQTIREVYVDSQNNEKILKLTTDCCAVIVFLRGRNKLHTLWNIYRKKVVWAHILKPTGKIINNIRPKYSKSYNLYLTQYDGQFTKYQVCSAYNCERFVELGYSRCAAHVCLCESCRSAEAIISINGHPLCGRC